MEFKRRAKMKNYLNQRERTRHVIIMAMQKVVQEFAESDAITAEERHQLKKTAEWVEKFNNSVLERLGEPYRRKVDNMLAINTLDFHSKYGVERDCISKCATEDLEPALKDLRTWRCIDCEKTCDFQDCAVYAIHVACDMNGNGKDDGCPFKW